MVRALNLSIQIEHSSPALNYFGTLIAGHLHVIESGHLMAVQFCNVFPNESKSCEGFNLPMLVKYWLGLFKRWIALSTGQVTIQRISIRETNCAIQWIEIYPVDSLIHLLNNWGLDLMMMNFPNKISLFCLISGWIHLS